MFLGKTPLEAKLERENERLRSELAYLRRLNEARGMSYSVMEEPRNIEAKISGDTLRLAILGGISIDPLEDGLHVYVVDRSQREHYKVGYFISNMEILTKRDRAYIMQHMIEQASEQIQRYL